MSRSTTRYVLLALLIVLIAVSAAMWKFTTSYYASRLNRAIEHKQKKEKATIDSFELADPAQAPASIRESVRLGYKLMLNTPQYASNYVGDRLSCTNCHFAGGDTTGGKNGGISLAGVAAIYPKYDNRSGQVIDLPTRINSCFERSMNGKPVRLDSPEMVALVSYLHWISRGVPIYQQVPWLGLSRLKSAHKPDAENGGAIYAEQCALCHGKEGQGDVRSEIPPVWGPKSYNDAAGLNNEATLASFIYYNMPYTDATLTVSEALDVASYISQQPRPHYDAEKK